MATLSDLGVPLGRAADGCTDLAPATTRPSPFARVLSALRRELVGLLRHLAREPEHFTVAGVRVIFVDVGDGRVRACVVGRCPVCGARARSRPVCTRGVVLRLKAQFMPDWGHHLCRPRSRLCTARW